MKKAIVAAAVACAACSPQDQQPVENRQTAEPAPAAPAAQLAPLQPPAPGTPGGLPDDRTPLEEPKGAIDPKSAEAAGQVVQSYGALVEQGRFTEAEKLWRDAKRADGVSEELRRYAEVHLQVGKPEEPEGAAGSIFVNVPDRSLRQAEGRKRFQPIGADDPAPGERRARINRGRAPLAHRIRGLDRDALEAVDDFDEMLGVLVGNRGAGNVHRLFRRTVFALRL